MPLFNGEELTRFIEQADWVAVNDYESELLRERTGLSRAQIAERVQALIVTRGSQGSHIYADGQYLQIPCAPANEVIDPTGCGDAYRAGLLYGLMQDMDWQTIGRIAALAGAYKIEKPGTQNHHYTLEAFKARFQEQFGYRY